jgi:hypothetical protein
VADQGSNYHTLSLTTRLPAAHWRKLNYYARASAALRQIKNAGEKLGSAGRVIMHLPQLWQPRKAQRTGPDLT